MYFNYNKILRYLLICLLVFSILWALRAIFINSYSDFTDYFYGAHHVWQHQNPYSPDIHYFTGQVYPPFTFLFFTPFILFSYFYASKVWLLISIISTIASLFFLAKMYKIKFSSTMSLFLSFLVCISFPFKFTLAMGQVNLLIVLFLSAVLYLLNHKKEVGAGVLLAFPLLIKFFPVLLVLYFVFLRKWKLLFAMGATLVIGILLTLLFISFHIEIFYFQHILPDLLTSWKGDYYNQALSGLLMRGISDLKLRNVLRGSLALLMLLLTIFPIVKRKTRNKAAMNLEIASILILSVLINNFSWQHHFVFLIVPYFVVAYTNYLTLKNKKIYFLLLISYIFVAINFPNPRILPLILQSHAFFGGLLLWIISLYMLFRE